MLINHKVINGSPSKNLLNQQLGLETYDIVCKSFIFSIKRTEPISFLFILNSAKLQMFATQ